MYKVKIFSMVSVLVFLVGGLLQTIGIVSNTLCTLSVILLFYCINLYENKKLNSSKFPYLYLLAIILTSTLLNPVRYDLALLYSALFVLTPYVVYRFIANNIHLFNFDKILKFALWVGVVQLPILLVQEKFNYLILLLSSRAISIEDVDFGTFFFANDHGMCFFLLCMIIFLLFEKNSLKTWQRNAFVICYCVTILSADSNTSSLLLVTILTYYFVLKLNLKSFISFLVSGIIAIGAFLIIPFINDLVTNKINTLNGKFHETKTTYLDAESAINKGVPERGDVVLYFEKHSLHIIGDGPYKYFDPIQKAFPKFANFSQYLWFYNDIGVLGVLGVILIFSFMYFRTNKLFSYKIIYLFMILVYSFFANTLSDLAFNIIFSIVILYKPGYNLKPIKNEHNLYSIPRLEEN